jgi:hypothetical protein
MSARRLGLPLGSVLALAALAGGIFLAGAPDVQDEYEWLGDLRQVVIQPPASVDQATTSTGAH